MDRKTIRFGPTIVRPKRIGPGGTIGIVAPAGSFDRDIFHQGLHCLESMGFQVVVSDDLYHYSDRSAGSARQRADGIHSYFRDNDIDAIFCARGGFGSMKLLPLLDRELIRAHPKIFMGFSDISALLSFFYGRCGLVVFHGPLVTTLNQSSKQTQAALRTAVTTAEITEISLFSGETIVSGTATGPVTGGNLATLCHLVGTPFASNNKGHILFLEDTNEAPYRIDRMMTHMRLAGALDEVIGLVLGSFRNCGTMNDISAIMKNSFRHTGIPIVSGLDVGHGTTNLTIPIGLKATLDADRKRLVFHEPATV